MVVMLKCWSRCSSKSKKEDVILDCEYFFNLDIVINNDGGVDGGDVVYLRRSTDGDDDEGGCHRVNGCHVVNGVGGGWVRGDSMKNQIFDVVFVVLGLNSRDYFAKFFIRKNCVLGECLRFNVEFVKQFRIQISRILGCLK
jgi:hypothetical protein